MTVNRKAPAVQHVPAEINVHYGEDFSLEVETDGDCVSWSYDSQPPKPISGMVAIYAKPIYCVYVMVKNIF